MREKLEAAWNEAPFLDEHDYAAWEHAYARFTRLLDAEAWLDAAMMLRLPGHRIKMTICEDRRTAADMWVHGPDPDPVGPSPLYDTPAEALLAAIEKARTT